MHPLAHVTLIKDGLGALKPTGFSFAVLYIVQLISFDCDAPIRNLVGGQQDSNGPLQGRRA